MNKKQIYLLFSITGISLALLIMMIFYLTFYPQMPVDNFMDKYLLNYDREIIWFYISDIKLIEHIQFFKMMVNCFFALFMFMFFMMIISAISYNRFEKVHPDSVDPKLKSFADNFNVFFMLICMLLAPFLMLFQSSAHTIQTDYETDFRYMKQEEIVFMTKFKECTKKVDLPMRLSWLMSEKYVIGNNGEKIIALKKCMN